ncbi:hypothetical protein ACVB8X_34535 [Streptomyces sp. NRAIS4]
MEGGKLAGHPASRAGKGLYGPFVRLLPPVPLHELFARAAATA